MLTFMAMIQYLKKIQSHKHLQLLFRIQFLWKPAELDS